MPIDRARLTHQPCQQGLRTAPDARRQEPARSSCRPLGRAPDAPRHVAGPDRPTCAQAARTGANRREHARSGSRIEFGVDRGSPRDRRRLLEAIANVSFGAPRPGSATSAARSPPPMSVASERTRASTRPAEAALTTAATGRAQDKTRQDKTGTARLERLPNRDLRGEVLLLGAWKTMARRAADRKRLSYSNLYIMCTTDNLVALDQISLTLQRALTSTCRKMPVMWKT